MRDLTSISIADIVANVISAFFWLYLASLLGESNYGQISYLLAIGGIASTAASIGATTSIIVYSAKNIKIESTLYLLSIFAAACTSIVTFFLVSETIGLSVYVLGSVIFGLVSAELLGKRSYKNYAIVAVTQKLLMGFFSILLYNFFDVNGVILGFGISFLPYAILIFRQINEVKINFFILKEHFSFVITNYIIGLAGIVSTSIDKLIIGPLFGQSLLGNYHLALQFLSVLQILPIVIYKYTLSHDARGTSNNKLKHISILISVGISILCVILAPLIIPQIFPKFTKAVELIQIISFAIIPISINYAYMSELLGREKNKIILFSSGLFFLLETTLIITLGSSIGVKGIALSYVIAISSQAALVLIFRKYESSTDKF